MTYGGTTVLSVAEVSASRALLSCLGEELDQLGFSKKIADTYACLNMYIYANIYKCDRFILNNWFMQLWHLASSVSIRGDGRLKMQAKIPSSAFS